MPRRSIAREPGEPRTGDEVPWHWLGLVPSRVVRVSRESGCWTRVRVRWQAGCRPVPAYPGQPEAQWSVPTDSEWIDRAAFEEQARQRLGRRG